MCAIRRILYSSAISRAIFRKSKLYFPFMFPADVDLHAEHEVAMVEHSRRRLLLFAAHVLHRIDIGVAKVRVLVNEAELPDLGRRHDEASEALHLIGAEAAGIHPRGDAGARGNGLGFHAQGGHVVGAVRVQVDKPLAWTYRPRASITSTP